MTDRASVQVNLVVWDRKRKHPAVRCCRGGPSGRVVCDLCGKRLRHHGLLVSSEKIVCPGDIIITLGPNTYDLMRRADWEEERRYREACNG